MKAIRLLVVFNSINAGYNYGLTQTKNIGVKNIGVRS